MQRIARPERDWWSMILAFLNCVESLSAVDAGRQYGLSDQVIHYWRRRRDMGKPVQRPQAKYRRQLIRILEEGYQSGSIPLPE